MDCMSKLMRKIADKKFACGKTKTKAIVGVLANWSDEKLLQDLRKSKFVVVSCDASNHKSTKLLPVLARYCLLDGESLEIRTRILHIHDIKNETSDTIADVIMESVLKFEIKEKVIGFLADNANVNFGSIGRPTDGNVHFKLEKRLNKKLIPIGCGAHI